MPSRSSKVFLVFLFSNLLSMVFPAFAAEKNTPTTLVFPSFLHTMGIRKATKTHLMLYTRNRVKVRDPQGLAIARLLSWDDPKEKIDDDEVTGYGVNSGENLVVFNRSMTSLGFYGMNENGNRALNRPRGAAALEDGNVYVADTGNHRIVHFYNPKQDMQFVGSIGRRGDDALEFQSPNDVAVDNAGFLYVADTGNHRIQILDEKGDFLGMFGERGREPGDLESPGGIAVTNGKERWSYWHDSFIVIIDDTGTRIQLFDLRGKFLTSKRLVDFGFDTGRMMFAAIDYYSNIWVTDFDNHCVHKFDRKLNYLTTFGKRGKGDREFVEPRGIGIYKRFGQVFIAERESAQYYWIGTDVIDLTVTELAGGGVIKVAFFLTEPSFITIDVGGDGPGRVLEERRLFSGHQTLFLNSDWQVIREKAIEEQADKEPFSKGKYEFQLTAQATYSSYKYFSKELEATLTIQ